MCCFSMLKWFGNLVFLLKLVFWHGSEFKEEQTCVIWYKEDQRLSALLVLLCTKKAESRSQWFVNCPHALGAVVKWVIPQWSSNILCEKSICVLVMVGNNFLDFLGNLAGEREELIRIIVGMKRESSCDKVGFGSSLCVSLSRL